MNKLVLLIDDDDDEFQILKDALRRCLPSYICSWAQSKEDAFNFLEEIIPSLILLDLNMPKINGIEYLKILKRTDRYKDIPVILYSTCITDHTRKEAHELGALACIEKTANMQALMGHLEKHLGKEIKGQIK